MARYKVHTDLHIRKLPVRDRNNIDNVVGIAKEGYEFESKAIDTTTGATWHKDGNGYWLWEGGLQEVTIIDYDYLIPQEVDHWWIKNYKIDKLHKLTKGKGIAIAIIDTGLDYNHPALKNKTNISYYNILKNSYKKEESIAEGYHGTACAGFIAANGPNIYGISPDADLIVIKATDYGHLSVANLILGIEKAIELNTDIISISYALPLKIDSDDYNSLKNVIDEAHSKNILVICSSGNSVDSQLYYPAAFEKCFSVGSSNRNKTLFNCSINNTTDILAPGNDLKTLSKNYTQPKNHVNGTSYATPIVAGICALLLSAKINGINTRTIFPILKSKSTNKDNIKSIINNIYHIDVSDLGIIDISTLI